MPWATFLSPVDRRISDLGPAPTGRSGDPWSRTPSMWVPRVRYPDPVPLGGLVRHGVGVPNPWHPRNYGPPGRTDRPGGSTPAPSASPPVRLRSVGRLDRATSP